MNKLFSFFSLCSLAAASVYGQAATQNQTTKSSNPCDCLDRGLELPMDTKCFAPAYLAPANIKLNDSWDINADISFIYWHVSQENMNVAINEPATGIGYSNMVYPDFEYKPGFKIGFGFNTNNDDWTGFFEYTWLHQSTSHTSTAGSGEVLRAVNVLDDTIVSYNSANTHWKMNMDKLDFGMSRPFYFSKRITVSPVGGLRALWIRENFNNTYSSATHDLSVRSKSHSWAIGPMAGSLARWFYGYGFRFEGKGNGALVYTRYTKVSAKQVEDNGTARVSHQKDYNCLRPMIDLGIGFGWGTYIGCQDYYIDLSASYDFSLLWDQNVIVNNIQSFNTAQPVAGTNGNLYMHGLTLNARFDF